jgi:sec-independent protein translocase protein TatA
MGMPSGFEILIILVIVLLLFGGKKIPELMKGLGGGIKNFKNAMKDDDKKDDEKQPQVASTESNSNQTQSLNKTQTQNS